MTLFPDLRLESTDWVRHTHKTVATFIEQQLAVNGWVNDPTNFGATPVVFEEMPPEEAGKDLVPNTVSINLGDVGVQQVAQMGGGLWSMPVPIFVDVYGEKASIAVAICDDVRRLLAEQTLQVFDFTDPANPVPFAGAYMELDQVVGPRKPFAAAEASADLRRNWRVVRALATTYFTAAI